MLLNQIRIRKHVNQILQPVQIGWSSRKFEDLKPQVEKMITEEKYSKPQIAIIPAVQHRESTEHADRFVWVLNEVRKQKELVKQKQLKQMIADGTFKTKLKKKRNNQNKKAQLRRKRQPNQQPTAQQAISTLADTEFEDESTEGKVLKVQVQCGLRRWESIVVYFYDLCAVNEDGNCEEGDLDEEHEYAECTGRSIKERC